LRSYDSRLLPETLQRPQGPTSLSSASPFFPPKLDLSISFRFLTRSIFLFPPGAFVRIRLDELWTGSLVFDRFFLSHVGSQPRVRPPPSVLPKPFFFVFALSTTELVCRFIVPGTLSLVSWCQASFPNLRDSTPKAFSGPGAIPSLSTVELVRLLHIFSRPVRSLLSLYRCSEVELGDFSLLSRLTILRVALLFPLFHSRCVVMPPLSIFFLALRPSPLSQVSFPLSLSDGVEHVH